MIFVVPESHAEPSGGNIYNRSLLKALRKKRIRVTALTAERALAVMRKKSVGSWWVDSLCLDKLKLFLDLQGARRRVYAIIHDLPSLDPGLSAAERRLREAGESKLLRGASGFLVTSAWTRSVLRKRGLGAKPILVVPPAAAVSPRGPHSVVRGFVGLMVNNLIRRKGVLEFLTCLCQELAETDVFTLSIAGRSDIETDYAGRCLALMGGHPVLKGKTKFLGPLRPAEMKRRYERSSVFISASETETFGMAVREARLFGLPVLALDARYVRDHFPPDHSGTLFRSIPALAKACASLIRNPGSLETLARRARFLAPPKTYDWEDAARLFLDQLP
jgi:glycosyltransferase involved in cell wall biosynthesis